MLLACLSVGASARLFSSGGLEIGGGSGEIKVACGGRVTIPVRGALWKLPKYRDLHYTVENTAVAWVDRLGRLHGERPGKTVLYVRDGKNNIGSARVIVTGDKKLSRGPLRWIFVIAASFLIFILLTGFRCFE